MEISENYVLFYKELKDLVKNLIGRDRWEKNFEIINEIFMYQNLRMPRINDSNTKLTLKYNIAEYLFYLGSNKKAKLKKYENSIQTVNTNSYGTNYWEFTKKKIIWARKSDKIKNEIDYDNGILEKIKMFDKLNKFNKYDSLEIKRR